MSKLRIGVIMGGPSSEHKISVWSGRNICSSLDKNKYQIVPITITQDGSWPIYPEKLFGKIDLAFLATHGEYGEDGGLQQFFDFLNIPYTGSSAIASMIGMNKPASYRLFGANGIKVPAYEEFVQYGRFFPESSPFEYPVVVKPASRGSSLGVSVAHNESEFKVSLRYAFKFGKRIVVQKYIFGTEIVVPVLEESWGPVALPPVSIYHNSDNRIFDYSSKYGLSQKPEAYHGSLHPNIETMVSDIAIKAHKSIGASGLSRIDMIIGNDGNVYVLEINTLPGLTLHCPLPKSAEHYGMSFSDLLDKVIDSAKRRYEM